MSGRRWEKCCLYLVSYRWPLAQEWYKCSWQADLPVWLGDRLGACLCLSLMIVGSKRKYFWEHVQGRGKGKRFSVATRKPVPFSRGLRWLGAGEQPATRRERPQAIEWPWAGVNPSDLRLIKVTCSPKKRPLLGVGEVGERSHNVLRKKQYSHKEKLHVLRWNSLHVLSKITSELEIGRLKASG